MVHTAHLSRGVVLIPGPSFETSPIKSTRVFTESPKSKKYSCLNKVPPLKVSLMMFSPSSVVGYSIRRIEEKEIDMILSFPISGSLYDTEKPFPSLSTSILHSSALSISLQTNLFSLSFVPGGFLSGGDLEGLVIGLPDLPREVVPICSTSGLSSIRADILET